VRHGIAVSLPLALALLLALAVGVASCSCDGAASGLSGAGGGTGGGGNQGGSGVGGGGHAGLDAGADAPPDGAGGSSCTDPPEPPLVNARLLAGDEILALYPAPEPQTGGVGFRLEGSTLSAFDAEGAPLWSVDSEPGALFGGFDFDHDGWPDLGVVHSQPLGSLCGSTPMRETWISIVRGQDGSVATVLSPLDDICWTFGGTSYPTSQWTVLGVLFGLAGSNIAVLPYYATTGWFFYWDSGFVSEHFFYPSTSSYDSSYINDLPNPWNTGTSYLENSHVANGLLVEVDGQQRLVFFTSGRAVQYAVSPFSSSQLVYDRPYLTAGRTDLAGRNYGLVARDPGYPDHLVLIAGTHGHTLYLDRIAGQPGSDDWGQIERHVSIYDLTANTVVDRFFSYAHDDDDGHKYEGRVAYPNSAFVRVGPTEPSRLAFNVFGAGSWTLHVTEAGSVDDALTIDDLYLWDIRDLDGDGTDEWICSPTPGGYLPDWQIELYHWNEQAEDVSLVHSYPGRLPAQRAFFRQPEKTTSLAFFYPTLTVAQDCQLMLLSRTQAGALEAVALP